MPKFFYDKIAQSIASSPIGKKRVETVMNNKFESSKEEMMKEFDEHPVTKEVQDGGENISGTLDGYGNLRAFIGFDDNFDPIKPLRDSLEDYITLVNSKRAIPTGNKVRYQFSVKIDKKSIKDASPLPWETGQSWAFGIEKGISGFGNFIFGTFKTPPSRSGEGLEVKGQVRVSTFKTVPYLNELFDNLIERLKK